MNHPEYLALLRAIVAEPTDDTPRLVCADWIEEHGDSNRAAFIRIQVELARLEAHGRGNSRDADKLREKERLLLGPLSDYRPLWAAEACPQLVRMTVQPKTLAGIHAEGADGIVFRRGFVEAVTCPAVDWLHHGSAVRRSQPVRAVSLTGCDRLTRDHWYDLMPALVGLDELELDDTPDGMLDWLRGWLPGTELTVVA